MYLSNYAAERLAKDDVKAPQHGKAVVVRWLLFAAPCRAFGDFDRRALQCDDVAAFFADPALG